MKKILTYVNIAWIFISFETVFLIYSFFDPKSSLPREFSQAAQILFCIWVLFTEFNTKINKMQVRRNPKEREKKIELIRKAIPILKDESNTDIRGGWENAVNCIKVFMKCLSYVWVAWLIFFIVSLIKTIYFPENILNNNIYVEFIEVAANTVACIAFYLCYKKLDDPEIDIALKIKPAFKYIVLFAALHLLLLTIFNDYAIYASIINNIFLLFSGIFNAAFIAILAGRLESKNIHSPERYTWTMYFYAALQPLIILTNLKDLNQEWINISANVRLWLLAIGKSLFYLFMFWIVDSKKLFYYFMVTPHLEKEGVEFENYKAELFDDNKEN